MTAAVARDAAAAGMEHEEKKVVMVAEHTVAAVWAFARIPAVRLALLCWSEGHMGRIAEKRLSSWGRPLPLQAWLGDTRDNSLVALLQVVLRQGA